MGITETGFVAGRGLTDEEIINVPGLASRWVQLPDGQRAHYVTSGDSGPAVVLLHGGLEGSSGTAGFRFMAPFLGARGFRVYCPDRPGYGIADISSPRYADAGAKANMDFLKMFVDALCLDTFHLGGNSMGCIYSCDFVITHPERVKSVFFIAGSFGDICPEPRVLGKNSKFSPNPDFVLPTWDGSHEGMLHQMNSIIYEAAAVWPELIDMRVKAGLRQREGRAKFGLPHTPLAPISDPNIAQIYSTKGRLDKLTIPMIYFYGLQDVLIPVENGFIQEQYIPNVQFFYPDECGHQGQTDQPEIFNQAAFEFFSTGKISWATAKKAGVSLRRPIDPKVVETPASGFPKPNPAIYSDIEALRKGLKTAYGA